MIPTLCPRHLVRIALPVLVVVLAAGCEEAAPAEDRAIAEQTITRFDTLVTTESGLIGRPAKMAVGPDGRVWLSDAMNHHLLVVDPDDGAETIGREGAGPGEFRRPNALHVSQRGVVVYDFGNRRTQWLDPDGTFRDSEVVDAGQFVPAGLNAQGHLVVPRLGQDERLARIVRPGSPPADIGAARGPMPATISMSGAREHAARREIPEEFANNVLPVMRADGGVWLVVQAEGVVERYAEGGELMWSRALPEQEIAAARERFYRIGEDDELPVTIPWTARDGAEVDGDLWLLTDHPETGSSILVIDGETGDAIARHPLSLGSPAWAFAVDPVRSVLFVSLTDEANLLRAPLPGSAHESKEPLSVHWVTTEIDPEARLCEVFGTDETIAVEPEPLLSLAAFHSAAVEILPNGHASVVAFLSAEARDRLAEVTADNVGRRLAILVDGVAHWTPLVQGPVEMDALPVGFGADAEFAAEVAARLNRAMRDRR